jgi:hypothetical protein
MAFQERFELPTRSLEGYCSIQLSYWNTGGWRGIRTLAALTNTNGLANRPLRPLEYPSTMVDPIGLELYSSVMSQLP